MTQDQRREATEGPAPAAGPAARSDTQLPTALAAISRLAYAHAKAAGVPLGPLLKRAHLTAEQIEDKRVRIKVRNQIEFARTSLKEKCGLAHRAYLQSEADLKAIES